MIDANKCKYKESVRDEDNDCMVYYFTYPKDWSEAKFYSEEEYGNVVSMCISLTIGNGGFYMQMSPMVEEDDTFTDVDWRSLYLNQHYTQDTVQQLLNLATDVLLPIEMDVPLTYDDEEDLYDQICDYVSDFLSDKTGFCHKGFEIDIQIKASKIQWDTSE